jgi:hypothetical protein
VSFTPILSLGFTILATTEVTPSYAPRGSLGSHDPREITRIKYK